MSRRGAGAPDRAAWIPRAASFVSQHAPLTMDPGATASVDLTFANMGAVEWDPAAGLKLLPGPARQHSLGTSARASLVGGPPRSVCAP